MSGPRWRRAPDPARPGTIYRSKPKLGRSRGLGAGPPYLDGSARPPADQTAVTPPGGVGTVYDDYGGGPDADPYGNLVDDPGYDDSPYDRSPAGGPADDGFADSSRSAGPSAYPGSPAGRAGYPGSPGGPPEYPGVPGVRPPRPGGPPTRTRRRWPRPRVSLIVLAVVLILIGYPILLGMRAWSSVNRIDALAPGHRVTDTADTPGRNYLVVGSDSRSDLSAAERKKLGTGSAVGQRTDTIMLLHVPSGGGPTVLVSVPRDSYISIPGHGKNKINSAYAFGGAPLLVRTLEQATGLRIDDYVETGLGGFANVVDALGGVTLCPKFNMKDHDAHINLKKGCQQMDGKTALGYARARHSDPRGDLGRVERQRETLAAIAKKMLAPTSLIQPWRALPSASAGGGALTIDKSTSPLGLAHFVLAMRSVAGGGGLSLTVPISNPNFRTPGGASAVQWDRAKALELFKDLKADDTNAIKPIAEAQKAKK
jgi:LCP family protein required for cell wall assembly